MKGTIKYFSVEKPSSMTELSIGPLMQEIKLVALKYHEFENRDLYLLIAFLAFSACQSSDAKKKIDDFSFENFSSSKRLSIETLMNELNHLLMEKIKR